MAIEKSIQLAEQALETNNFPLAEKSIKDALSENSKSLKGNLLKCTLELRQKDFQDSLRTSLSLIRLAIDFGKREYISNGLYHAAMAEFKLKNYKDAFKYGVLATKYNSTDNELSIFLGMARNKLKKMENMSDTALDELKASSLATKENSMIPERSAEQEADLSIQYNKKERPKVKQASITQRPKQNLRTDWYESGDTIDISLYMKRIDKDSVKSKFGDHSLSVQFKTIDGQTFDYEIPKLFSGIVPSQCHYLVFGTKMELSLLKQENIKWSTLEYQGDEKQPLNKILQHNTEKSLDDKLPSYPTSSKKKIDWSKFDEEESDKEQEGDPALKFFQSLYANADEDTKRAMMKSYVESNGTSLSTDWSKVGKNKVKTVAPDGTEVKEWDDE